VLLWLKSDGAGGLLAEVEEAADAIAELGELAIGVEGDGGGWCGVGHIYIVSRYKFKEEE